MLMKAFAPRICLTEREKKEYLGLFTFFFKEDDNLVDRLCTSDTKVTIICKDLDELLDVYYDVDRGSERTFDVIILLSTDREIIPVYSNMLSTAFGAWTLYPVAIASEWYVSSAKVNHAQVKLHFMSSKRNILEPLRLPFVVASRFMEPKVIAPNKFEAATKYLHLHDAARMSKSAISLPFGSAYLWTGGAILGFKLTTEGREDANIPICPVVLDI